jgi:hypothetical protein
MQVHDGCVFTYYKEADLTASQWLEYAYLPKLSDGILLPLQYT